MRVDFFPNKKYHTSWINQPVFLVPFLLLLVAHVFSKSCCSVKTLKVERHNFLFECFVVLGQGGWRVTIQLCRDDFIGNEIRSLSWTNSCFNQCHAQVFLSVASLILVQEKLGCESDKPVSLFVFHGGSGSSLEDIRYAIEAGVVKMNIDTDTQWAFWDGMNEYQKKNKDYLQAQKLRLLKKKWNSNIIISEWMAKNQVDDTGWW